MNAPRRWRTALVHGAAAAGALVVAKLVAYAAVPAPTPWWRLCCDDLVVATLDGVLAAALPRSAWLLSGVVVASAVLGAWCVRALGMPFLPTMLVGVDPVMRDSVGLYLTFGNALVGLGIVGGAWLGGWLTRRGLASRPAAPKRAEGGELSGERSLLPRRDGHGRTTRRLTIARATWVLGGIGGVVAAAIAMVVVPPAHPAHRGELVAFVRGLLPRGLPAAVDAFASPRLLAEQRSVGERSSRWHGIAAGRSAVMVVLESAPTRFVFPDDGPSAMPFVQRMAGEGLHCPLAWAVYPDSIEGQVAILCGSPPRADVEPTAYGADGANALPRRIRGAGYRSALFHAGRFHFLGMADVLAPMGFDHLADSRVIGGAHQTGFGCDETTTVDALLQWIATEPPASRVFAAYLPIAGHHPYDSPSPGPFVATSMRDCSRNALHHCDRAIERLWRGLLALRPAEQWLLCIVGDHGQAFGEHPGNHGHSFELFEENLRVPLLFVAPGSGLAGRFDGACSHLEVAPTLLELLGIGDCGSVLLHEASTEERAARVVTAFTDWGDLLAAARDQRWKLIHDVTAGRDRLFDLQQDPNERFDVAAAHPAHVTRLRAAALTLLRPARAEPH